MTIDRDMLAAYAEGQLDGAEAARVEAAMAADPALAAEVEAHRALRARLQAHFAPIAAMPVPDRLIAAARQGAGADVVDLASARERKTRPMLSGWIAGGAIAASLLLGLLVGGGMSSGGSFGGTDGRIVARGALDRALTTRLSSETGEDMRVLLSFRNGEGHYCRAFETGDLAGLACREGGDWSIQRLQAGNRRDAGDYRQASSPVADIMAAAQGMAQGEALDRRAEIAARDKGWRE